MFFNFTVEDFLSSTDISGNKPDAGKQFVAVKLKVENTFGQDIQMFSTDFLLEWDKTSADDKGVDGPHSYYDKDAIFNEEFEKEMFTSFTLIYQRNNRNKAELSIG